MLLKAFAGGLAQELHRNEHDHRDQREHQRVLDRRRSVLPSQAAEATRARAHENWRTVVTPILRVRSWGAARLSGRTTPPRRLTIGHRLASAADLERPIGWYAMQGEAAGRVALVTGAGSPTGIGFATAAVLGREGAAVAICSTTDRIHDAGRRAAGDGLRRRRVRRRPHRPRPGPGAWSTRCSSRFGRIDILVNNAGMVTVDDPDETGRGRSSTLADARLGPRHRAEPAAPPTT